MDVDERPFETLYHLLRVAVLLAELRLVREDHLDEVLVIGAQRQVEPSVTTRIINDHLPVKTNLEEVPAFCAEEAVSNRSFDAQEE